MRAAEEVGDKVALLERYRKTRDGRPRQEGTDRPEAKYCQIWKYCTAQFAAYRARDSTIERLDSSRPF